MEIDSVDVDPRIKFLFNSGVIKRFADKLELGENGCIEWTGALRNGYGRISIGPRETKESISTHRWAMQFALGGIELPPEIHVCHKCDNPGCVNPIHLFTGTHQDNMDDKVTKCRSVTVFGNAKLNWDIVDDIRSSNLSGVDLGNKHSVARSTISEIRNNLIWKEENREKAIL
jgi:hypothetical protein